MSDILHTVNPNLAVKSQPKETPDDIASAARAKSAVMAGDLPPGGHQGVRHLRRVDLWKICTAHKLEFDASADDWYKLVGIIEAHYAKGNSIFPLPAALPPEPPDEAPIGENKHARVDTKKEPFFQKKKRANEKLEALGLPLLGKSAGSRDVQAALEM